MKIISAASVRPREIRYLVRPFIPAGSFVLMDGDPAAGKSYVCLSVAAALTRGEPLPFETEGETRKPTTVIYLGGEDAGHIIRERAEAAGADLDRLLILAGDPVSLTEIGQYRDVIVQHGASLVVLDPLQAFTAGINVNSMGKVRAALTPLVQLARETGASFLAVRHLSKGSTKAAYRGFGSIDWRACSRSAVRLGRDPAHPSRRVLVHSKSSLSARGATQEYEIATGVTGEARVFWLGRSEISEADLDVRPPRQRRRTAIEIAKEFLDDVLLGGPMPAREIRQLAHREGIADRTLDNAKRELGVRSRRVAGEGHGAGHWEWLTPDQEREPKDSPGDRDDASLSQGDVPDHYPEDLPDREDDDSDPADWWRRGGNLN